MASNHGWIGVDLDGTLAEYHGWVGPTDIGKPIPAMVERIKSWLKKGIPVRIFTARLACDPLTALEIRQAIFKWTQEHIGMGLTATCIKDMNMLLLFDDRAIAVEENTGAIAHFRELP